MLYKIIFLTLHEFRGVKPFKTVAIATTVRHARDIEYAIYSIASNDFFSWFYPLWYLCDVMKFLPHSSIHSVLQKY